MIKVVVSAIIVVTVVFAFIFFLSIFLTKHTLTPTSLVLRQGINLKAVVDLGNILTVAKVKAKLSIPFGIHYLADSETIQITTGTSNLIEVELLQPQIFKPLLGRKIKAQKIVFNVDKPESFLESVTQKLKKTVRESKSKEQELISTPLPLASNIRRANKAGQCAIKVTNLTKKYDDFVAVEKLNIEVNYGEIFGFLGPNGAGKTTTINTIVGLLKPDAGSIKIGNFDLKSETLEAKAMFGYVAETPIVYENLTGAEFLQFVAKLYPVDKSDTAGRIERFLDLFNLNEWKDKPIKIYSQGMRRKIAIAAALVHNPRILILDEPTNGLDPAGIHKVKEVLFELRSKEVAILMSTHILEIAERMCDRVGIINRGRIVAQGQLSKLLKSTKDKKSSLEEIFLNLTK